jgi:hypothetical protein
MYLCMYFNLFWNIVQATSLIFNLHNILFQICQQQLNMYSSQVWPILTYLLSDTPCKYADTHVYLKAIELCNLLENKFRNYTNTYSVNLLIYSWELVTYDEQWKIAGMNGKRFSSHKHPRGKCCLNNVITLILCLHTVIMLAFDLWRVYSSNSIFVGTPCFTSLWWTQHQ